MRSVWLLALATFGCRSILGIDEPIITIDAGTDAPVSCTTWHPQGFDPCALGAPAQALHLTPGQYTFTTTKTGGRLSDTTGHVLLQSDLTIMQSDSSTIAVMSVAELVVDAGATVNVVGLSPLLVVAWSTMSIDGALDAGSYIGVTDAVKHTAQTVRFGAGANESCGPSTGNTGKDGGNAITGAGSSGGGGGGFRGAGGAGARGANASTAGGAGGVSVLPSVIRGGCPGGASGTAGSSAIDPAKVASSALGGAGGGAIRLVAHDSITVAGSVSANGAGGAGAPQNSACGGGGGGSGGYVALEAPAVTIGEAGVVTANGGGGGGGGVTTDAGNDGADGKIDLLVAPGGAANANGCGKSGGAGSVATQLDGSNGPVPGTCGGGGGGGGGGAGFIFISSAGYTTAGTAKLSPPVMLQ
jgi:hypothetical protein